MVDCSDYATMIADLVLRNCSNKPNMIEIIQDCCLIKGVSEGSGSLRNPEAYTPKLWSTGDETSD